MIVCKCESHLRGAGHKHISRCLHGFRRALVHCDIRNLKPALLLKMLLEVNEERCPHLCEDVSTRLRLDSDGLSLSLIHIFKLAVPRDHRVAVELPVDSKVNHELHPPVKDLIIIAPCTVLMLCPNNHRFICIKALMVPWILVKSCRDDLLTCICQSLHERFHSLEMSIAP